MHEQLVRHDLLAGLLDDEPELAGDVVFGLRAATYLDERLDSELLAAWSAGRSVLDGPSPEASGTSDDGVAGRARRRWLVSQNG